MNHFLIQGIVIGIIMGLLVGLFFVAFFAGDWSWLIFGGTLGIAMGIGIAIQLDPVKRR